VVLPAPESLDIAVYCIYKVCPDDLRRGTELHIAKLGLKIPEKCTGSPCECNITRNSLHVLELTVLMELSMWLKMF